MAVAAVSAPALPSAARAFIGAVIAAGATVLAAHAVAVAEHPVSIVWQTLAIAAAVVLADQFRLTLAHGGEQEHFALTDAVWIAAIVLAAPGAPTLGAALGALAWQAWARVPVTKLVFNVGQVALALTAGELIWGLGGGGISAADPSAWALAALAAAAIFAVNEVTVAMVIALAGGERFRDVALGSLRVSVLQWLGNVSIGLLAVTAWQDHPAGILLIVVPLVLLYLADREWVNGLVEREQMEDMARTAESIARRADPSARLPVIGRDGRLLRLTASLNAMLEQLEQAFARQHHLMSDAARALDGPVRSVRAELAQEDAARDAVALLDRATNVLEHMEAVAGAGQRAAVRPRRTALAPFMQDVGRCAPPALDGRLQLADVPEGAEGDIDPRWTRRALLSLLDNAAVHGRGSGPVELCAVDTPDGWRFEVTDHGGGIPVGHESSVFEPFYRAGSDRNMPGLGLALVRSVAEAHGGSAGLLNRPGTGVTFWLCVPR